MKNPYSKKARVASVRVYFTPDQIAMLMNSALARSASLSIGKEAQFVVDWALSDAGGFHDFAEQLGSHALLFDAERLPNPQEA